MHYVINFEIIGNFNYFGQCVFIYSVCNKYSLLCNSCIQHPWTQYKYVNSTSYGTHTLWEDSMTYETHIMRRIIHISNDNYCKPRGTVAWYFQWIRNQINAQKFHYFSLRVKLWYFQWIRNKKFTNFITALFSLFAPHPPQTHWVWNRVFMVTFLSYVRSTRYYITL